jgi:hypothetical protein
VSVFGGVPSLCRVIGHEPVTLMLPEDLFGLFVYSRIECSRCDRIIEVGMSPEEQASRLAEKLRDLRDLAEDACRAAAPIGLRFPALEHALGIALDAKP